MAVDLPAEGPDLVPADSVDELIDAVRGGLVDLHGQVTRAEADAAQAEAQLRDLVAGPRQAGDRMDLLEASIDGYATSGREHLRLAIDAAHAQAAARLAAARADAERIVVEARAEVAALLAGAPAPVVPVAPIAAPAPFPVAEPLPILEPHPTVVTHAVVAPVAPVVQTAAPAAPPVVADTQAIPVIAPVVAPVPTAAAPDPAPAPAGDYVDFWEVADTADRSKTNQLEGLTTALLPMLALIIVLVVVLAWIG